MAGLIGKKIGMTSVYNDVGTNIPCTVIQAGPCKVTQVKNKETDGYEAVQLGFDDKKEKHTTRAQIGHFKKANSKPQKQLIEFKGFDKEFQLGDEVNVEDIFGDAEMVHVRGMTKGKGYQGVVKRHGFAGPNDATHGQHKTPRASGSIGMSSDPSRVWRGKRMAGQTGNRNVKVRNIEVIKIMKDENLILVKGGVPGANGSYLIIEK